MPHEIYFRILNLQTYVFCKIIKKKVVQNYIIIYPNRDQAVYFRNSLVAPLEMSV